MAQVIFDGKRMAILKSHSAETINIATLVGAPTNVAIERIDYDMGASTDGMISWEATVNATAWTPFGVYTMDWQKWGGITNNAGAGKTGNVVIAGTGSFTIILHLRKP
jgi:hypothetical protein